MTQSNVNAELLHNEINEANRRIQACIDGQMNKLDLSELGLTAIPLLLTKNTARLNKHLTELNLYNNQIRDINPLKALINLTKLYLSRNQISDIHPLQRLNKLIWLDLSRNQISDIHPLHELNSLIRLILPRNQISDISSLQGLGKLIELYLPRNRIIDIRPLQGLNNLIKLDLSSNKISDISSLQRLDELAKLYLSRNQISNISSLKGLNNLTELHLDSNQILDISPLHGLNKLTRLYSFHNKINDISSLQELVNLIKLDLSRNQINDISSLQTLYNLTKLTLFNNQFSDIQPLQVLVNNQLSYLNIQNTPFSIDNNFSQELNANHLDDLKLYFEKQKHAQIEVSLPNKVLFLGNHASGKSSTLHYLQKHTLADNPDSTHVLNIEYLEREPKLEIEATATDYQQSFPLASCYDFGGQDFYHGIYRIFLQNAGLIVLLVNPANNHNKRDQQHEDSANDTIKEQQTHYFDCHYWRGLLNYIQSAEQNQLSQPKQNPTETTMPMYFVQSHATLESPMDWQLPDLFNKACPAIQLLSPHHLNLKQTDGEQATPIKLNSFYQQFINYLNQEEKTIECAEKEVNFLIDLIKEQQADTDTAHHATNFANIRERMDNLISGKLIHTQMQQYTKAGLVLYDENLSCNKISNDTKDNDRQQYDQHIVWLNPKALVEFIHENILSQQQSLNKHKGRVAENKFLQLVQGAITDTSADNPKYDEQQAIIELLQHHLVIYKHEFADDIAGKIEYIIPNYLLFSNEDRKFKMDSIEFNQVDLCLKFTDFIPIGMMNQFVNLFGRLPDIKRFWRDCMIFTLTTSASDTYKVLLQINMEKLTISAHINTYQTDEDKNKIISYLYYCIMNAYWSYVIGVNSVEFGTFNDWWENTNNRQNSLDNQLSNSHQHNAEKQLFNDLFNLAENVIPDDMYVSRNGEDFINLNELNQLLTINESVVNTHNYHLASSLVTTSSDRQSRELQVEPINVLEFQPFTHKILTMKATTNSASRKKLANKAKIFISFNHNDLSYKETLVDCLLHISDQGHHVFEDIQIRTDKINKRIKKELKKADVVVFMLSENFFNSQYIMREELPRVMKRSVNSKQKPKIIPVLVSVNNREITKIDEITQMIKKSPELEILMQKVNKDNNKELTINSAEDVFDWFNDYVFLPTYRQGEGDSLRDYLRPMQKWDENLQKIAYRQIVNRVNEAIDSLSKG